MEENNNTENNYTQYNTVQKEHHYWKECLFMIISAFLGGFLAMYFVADQIFDRHYHNSFMPDKFERKMIKDFEKMYERDRKAFEQDWDDFTNFDNDLNKTYKNSKKDLNQFKLSDNWFNKNKKENEKSQMGFYPLLIPDMTIDSVKIHSLIEDGKYKVIVGLKAFNGDESKINYNVSGRKLTVFGKYQINEEKYQQDISFSQDFILPKNSDISKIKKEKENNNLIIEVPLKY